MRWTTWTLSLAALALLVVVGTMVSRQSRVTPEDFLAAVEQRIDDGRYDRDQTLLNLDQVLERAREAADLDLETRVLLRRGRLLMDLGAWDRARRDLLAVAERRPEDRIVENDLIELDTRAGDFAAAETRVRRELEREPGSTSGWTRLGRLHRLAAKKHEAAAVLLMSRLLARAELAEAERVLLRATALDVDDLERPAQFETLRTLLRGEEEGLHQEVLRIADRAAASSADARDAFARSLESGVTAEPLAGLFELFAQAGRSDLTADLASATLRFDVLRSDASVARALLESLEDLGRFRYASELARPWSQGKVPLDAPFLQLLARIGLAADRWDLLFAAGGELRGVGNADDAAAANFFQGLGLVKGGQHLPGRQLLRLFVASTAPEPVPGARATAWRAIATSSRELREPEFEREALQGAIELEPDHDGELHLRLAELLLAAPHGGFRAPDRRFAYGMSLMPGRMEELLPRWHEIGARELTSIGFDPAVVRSGLLRNRVWTPASDASPYELYRLAEIHLAAGDVARARAHLDRLLQLAPGFLPALDLVIEVERLRGDRTRILAAVATRVATGGRTDETSAVLREIPFDELRPEAVRKLVRSDPEYFGRIAVARGLAEAGRPRAALDLLRTIPPETLGDEARVLSARLHLGAGEAALAWSILAPMGRALAGSAEAAALAVRAGAFGGATPEARGLLKVLALESALPRAVRLDIARSALAAGEIEGARALLDGLDSRPLDRGGDLCIEIALAAALAGDEAGVERALARAEAFETRGGLERAALAIAVHANEKGRWKVYAGRVGNRAEGAEPLLAAALLVLQGREDEARTRIEAALGRTGAGDARWSLLAQALAPASPRAVDPRLGPTLTSEAESFVASLDPDGDRRSVAGLVAQLASPEGLALAAARLRAHEQADQPGRVWTTWLLATLDRRVGDVGAARRRAEAVCRAAPDFPPAWDLLEELDPELRLDPVRHGIFRGERLRALGATGAGSSAQNREDRARLAAARGEHATAVEIADANRDSAPPTAELAAIAGRSLLALGRPREAVERLARALSTDPGPIDLRGTTGLLLEALASAESLPVEESQAVLRQLALQHADDPRLVLALARIDLKLDDRNPALGVRRALARLDDYRLRFRGRSLDHKVLGAAAAWIDFLSRIDPARALQVADEELDLAPGSFATWVSAARAHHARGDAARALRELAIAGRIADRGDVSREILRIRARSDMDAAEIGELVATIARLEGRAEPDASLHVLAARSFLNLGPRLALQSLASARKVLDDPAARLVDRSDAALLAAVSILARGGEEELATAGELLASVRLDGASRTELAFLRALRGLSRVQPRSP